MVTLPQINKQRKLDQTAKVPKVKVGKIRPLTEFALQDIKKRYCFSGIYANGVLVNGGVNHHADCAIFRSLEQYDFAFCSCGLLHDLESLSGSDLIEIIYPRYWHDYYLQESGEDTDNETPETKAAKQQEREECKRVLYEIFGPPDRTSLSEIKNKHEKNRELLVKVFGKNFLIDGAGHRLNERMQEDIENYRLHERHKVSGFSS